MIHPHRITIGMAGGVGMFTIGGAQLSMVEVGFTILINVPRHNFHRACSSCKMSQNLKLKLIKYEIAIQFQKTLKYGIAIHAKSQSSSKKFYKSEIEN